jgi:hypothetical protein
MVVFSLALFTISEASLVGLLSPELFDKLKNGELKGLLAGTEEPNSIVDSVNELSKLIIDGYRIFISEMHE